MKPVHFLLIFFFVISSGLSFGQGDSTLAKAPVLFNSWTPHLYLFNKTSPNATHLLYSPLHPSGSRFDPKNLNLPTDWSDETLSLYESHQHLSLNPYPPNLMNDWDRPFDPANPYGVTNVTDDLILGAINFLLFQLGPPCK